jgi:hypothetical protein
VAKISRPRTFRWRAVTAPPFLAAADFPTAAEAIVNRFLAAGLHVRKPGGVERKAWGRIAANVAPSQRGQQAKDCIILESYLDLARGLRATGFNAPVVYFTSNTRDYSDPVNAARLHPSLVAEFDALNIRYAVNFGMAEHLLSAP